MTNIRELERHHPAACYFHVGPLLGAEHEAAPHLQDTLTMMENRLNGHELDQTKTDIKAQSTAPISFPDGLNRLGQTMLLVDSELMRTTNTAKRLELIERLKRDIFNLTPFFKPDDKINLLLLLRGTQKSVLGAIEANEPTIITPTYLQADPITNLFVTYYLAHCLPGLSQFDNNANPIPHPNFNIAVGKTKGQEYRYMIITPSSRTNTRLDLDERANRFYQQPASNVSLS